MSSRSNKRRRVLTEALAEQPNSAAAGPLPLYMSPTFVSENDGLVLVEVPPALLTEVAEDSDKGLVRFVGSNSARLVTGSKTFSLTLVETSNTVMVLPPVHAPQNATVNAICKYHYELKRVVPDWDALRTLLSSNLYDGHTETSGDSDGEAAEAAAEKFSLERLEAEVHVSRAELVQGLKQLKALNIDGWRLLSPAYEKATFDKILNVVVERDLPLHAVDAPTVAQELLRGNRKAAGGSSQEQIVKHCLWLYSDQSKCKEGGDVFTLDENQVAIFKAHILFSARATWPASEWASEWAASVPGVDAPSQELMRGIGFLDEERVWHYFPASRLPHNPAARFAALFAFRSRWTRKDLEPYLESIADQHGETASQDELLLRHARELVTNQPGSAAPLYCSRI